MQDDLTLFARLGLVHHMLYPESLADFDYHARTLEAIAHRSDIETFDYCVPYGTQRRQYLTQMLLECGKEDIVFSPIVYPFRKMSLCSTDCNEQVQSRMIVKDLIDQAIRSGASGYIIASGGPSPNRANSEHHQAFANQCRWICSELKPFGITAMLEPFDTAIDKKFLYGSTASCVELINSLKPEVNNFGIELDFAHLPLLGEDFADAVNNVSSHLARVHLGNCVLKDTSHPRYGDTHPPIGYEDGEIDVPELTEILRLLLEVGFLNKAKRGSLVLEITPWPGKSMEETVADNMGRLQEAWEAV